MRLVKIFGYLLIYFCFSKNYLIAQDTLHLITTITGTNIETPIYNASALGDINGDGFNEFGIKQLNTDYFDIYFGSNRVDSYNKTRFYAPNDLLGHTGIGTKLGDVNKDGFDDFLLSGSKDHVFHSGKVYLYFGGETIDQLPDFSFEDIYLQDLLSGGTGGDFNGDGYDDFTVKNPYNWTNGIGRVYLFLGGETIVDTPFVTFVSDSLEDFFGSVANLEGDINGDGFNDLIITSPMPPLQSTTSKCFFFFGGKTISFDSSLYIEIPHESNIEVVDDFNKNKSSEFFVTISNKLYLGDSMFSENDYLEFSSSEEMDSFGETAGSAGDINNDGYGDLIIGATNHRNNDDIMVGGAYIFLGGTEPNTTSDFVMEGETKWSHFGWKVGSLGDLNGDGYDEIYVLADGYPDNEKPLGKVYIYSMKKFIVDVVNEKPELTYEFNLYQNYPNPYNPTTTISYQLPKASNVVLKIYDVLGKEVAELVNENKSAGIYNVNFNASNLPSGLYFYKIQAGEFTETRKMLLMK